MVLASRAKYSFGHSFKCNKIEFAKCVNMCGSCRSGHTYSLARIEWKQTYMQTQLIKSQMEVHDYMPCNPQLHSACVV